MTERASGHRCNAQPSVRRARTRLPARMSRRSERRPRVTCILSLQMPSRALTQEQVKSPTARSTPDRQRSPDPGSHRRAGPRRQDGRGPRAFAESHACSVRGGHMCVFRRPNGRPASRTMSDRSDCHRPHLSAASTMRNREHLRADIESKYSRQKMLSSPSTATSPPRTACCATNAEAGCSRSPDLSRRRQPQGASRHGARCGGSCGHPANSRRKLQRLWPAWSEAQCANGLSMRSRSPG